MRRTYLIALIAVSAALCHAQSNPPQAPAPATTPPIADALHAYRTGKFDEAIQKYNQVIASDPKSIEAYAGLVRVYIKQNDIEKAEDAANHAVGIDPQSTIAETAQAELFFRQGKIAEAEQLYVKVINSGELNARAYWGLARIRSATSMHKRAKDLLERAHSFDPADPEIQRYWMGTLKRAERIKFLQTYLSQPTNDDARSREHLEHYLELLQDREQNARQSCRLVNKIESTETELRPLMIDPRRVRGLGLNVSFNDHKSRLLLDTGASGLMVKKSIAEKAGITPVVHSKASGIGDAKDMNVYLGYASSIRIGDLEFQNCLVTVSDKALSGSEDGLIGADVFSRYLVDLDFQNQKMRLSPLPKRPEDTPATQSASLNTEGDSDDEHEGESANSASGAKPEVKKADPGPQDRYIAPEMQNYTRILRFGHALLMPTRIGDSTSKWFLIDTGAAMNGISPAAAREVTKVHSDDHVHVKGLSGEVDKVFTADKAVLQFARFRQENQDIISWDLSKISKDLGIEVSGMLGFTTLHLFDIKIDYRDGLVDFVYDTKQAK